MFQESKKNPLRLPPGIQDFIFQEAKKHRHVERGLCEMLEGRGFNEIITPTFEYGDIFEIATKSGMIRNGLDEKVYRFLDRDGNLLALRADFTAQIARIAASRFADNAEILKIFYSGKVFRAEPQLEGRSRETWQVGFEILNEKNHTADIEAIINVLEALSNFKIEHFKIAIGHIGYFHGLLEQSGLQGHTLKSLKYLIERKDAAGLESELSELKIDAAVKKALLQIPELHGDIHILEEAQKLAVHPKSAKAIEKLQKIWREISNHPLSKHVFFDLSEVEGMGYYTGLMIRAFAQGVGSELGSGGRYDQLTAVLGAEMPAVGFSFDVDRVMQAIEF